MQKFSIANKTVLITGASSGIGKACAELFASHGTNVVLTARRLDRLQQLAQDLSSQYCIKATPIQLDVQKYRQVEDVFKQLDQEKISIDILVNNAGLALSTDKLQEGNIANWDIMIDTNIKGLLYLTKAALTHMLKSNYGHIINIGSIAGHSCYLGGNVYCATKHAVRAITHSLRFDLLSTPLRVSEIDPGAVHTEFSEVRWQDKEKANKLYEGFSPLVAEDIADAVVYCATRPLHVNVSQLVVYPQAQASVMDIYRI